MGDRTLAFYKPYGVLTQFTGEAGQRTLKEFVDVAGVYAAGRLDQDSEGLLILTSDGALQHELTDPKFGHEKTYWVQVEGVPDRRALKALEEGVVIQGEKTRPARARLMASAPEVGERVPPIRERKSIPTSWIEVTLREGRNRQVRRMTAAVGYPTLRLVRASVGGVGLEALKPGQWRELSAEEISRLKPAGRGVHLKRQKRWTR